MPAPNTAAPPTLIVEFAEMPAPNTAAPPTLIVEFAEIPAVNTAEPSTVSVNPIGIILSVFIVDIWFPFRVFILFLLKKKQLI